MKYLLLVSHATLGKGVEEALAMLLGSRSYIVSCGMADGMSPDAFRASVAKKIAPIGADDDVVVLADIAGGSPLKNTFVALDDKGLGERVIAFGGMNLAMAISAVMSIDDGLDMDAIRDSLLAEGVQSVKQI